MSAIKNVTVMVFGACAAAAPLAVADSCLVDPVSINPNMVTSNFGKTRDLPQYNGVPHVHWGTDFQARNPANPGSGADLVAADAGTVIGAGFWGSGYGNRVAIKRDNGDIITYSHLAKIEPALKSGASIGFKSGGAGLGTVRVSPGDKIGVAGGTASHQESNDLAVHLHLEYVTNYQGNQLRETNDGTNSTRSRYLRNPLDYMCRVPTFAAGAGTPPAQGQQPAGSADPQQAAAAASQPSVTDRERYGTPDAPPYDTYEGMSESQVIEAEMLRRTLDLDWEENLAEWGNRGIWMEITRIDGVMAWIDNRIAEKRSRIEGMLATLLALRVNSFITPNVTGAYDQLTRMSAAQRVN